MKISNEVKIGLFVILAVLVGFVMWVKTKSFDAKETYQVKTKFNYAGGIRKDSMVSLSGIEVGRVTDVKFIYTPQTQIEVTLLLDTKAKVHEDSIAYIDTTGFIGDSYIGLTSGSPESPFVRNNAHITSEDPMSTREIMKKASAIADKIDETLVDVKGLAKNLNTTLADNKSKINDIVKNLEETSENFNSFSADIKAHPWKLLFKGKD